MNAPLLWKFTQMVRQGTTQREAQSDPDLGAGGAVLVPLCRKEGTWQLCDGAPATVPLDPVTPFGWSPVRRFQAPGATHYACIVRYDQPRGRPGPTHPSGAAAAATAAGAPIAIAPAAAGQVSLEELADGFAWALRNIGEPRNYLIDATNGPAQPARSWFAFASCQYPAGMMDRELAHASYRALAGHLQQEPTAPAGILLLGDQVYVDATYGLLDPVRLDDRYGVPYEALWDPEHGPLRYLTQSQRELLWMTPDDHEIADNWEPDGSPDPRLDKAMDAYWEKQRGGAPRQKALQIRRRAQNGAGWHLFMADTRTQRQLRTDDTVAGALMLGTRQTRELECWLGKHVPREDLKIVTSPAMLLPRTREYMDEPLYQDNWQGYPASFHRMLAFLCDRQIANVVFLSGDAHLACTAHVQVRNVDTGASVEFQSHHAPALYAPYPFANEAPCNLLLDDQFTFTHGCGRRHTYECTVQAAILGNGGNGWGLLEASRHGSRWVLRVGLLQP